MPRQTSPSVGEILLICVQPDGYALKKPFFTRLGMGLQHNAYTTRFRLSLAPLHMAELYLPIPINNV